MSVEQYVQIGQWLVANRSLIENRGHSQTEVQILITSALEYEVPLSSLVRCAKAVKIKWAGSPTKPPPPPIGHEAMVIIIAALAGIYIETERTVPDDLANLQSTYAKETK